MERREAPGCLRGTPGEPCEGPPRAVAIRRAHPNDVGVRRLPALHVRRFDRGHVLPAPTAPLPICPGPSNGPRRISLSVHDMFFQPAVSTDTFEWLSDASTARPMNVPAGTESKIIASTICNEPDEAAPIGRRFAPTRWLHRPLAGQASLLQVCGSPPTEGAATTSVAHADHPNAVGDCPRPA